MWLPDCKWLWLIWNLMRVGKWYEMRIIVMMMMMFDLEWLIRVEFQGTQRILGDFDAIEFCMNWNGWGRAIKLLIIFTESIHHQLTIN